MTVDAELEASADEQEAPPDDQNADEHGEDGSGSGEPAPRPEATAREKALEERLRRQGSELAQAKRIAAQATADVASVRGEVARITERLSANDKESAERREREMQNYLASLPPEQRTAEELKFLKAEVRSLRTNGTVVQPAQPATRTDAAEDPEVTYMRARAQEILTNVSDEFGVELTREDIASLSGTKAWDSEGDFEAAVTRLAAKKSRESAGGTTVANKATPAKPETEAQMRERLTREITEGTGAGSPATPRAAGKPGRRPTEEDVRATVNSYNSAAGPKANIAKLKAQRAKMD